MNCFKLLTFSKLLWVFSLICNPASAQPVTWNSSTSYSVGELVIVGTSTYIATQSVPENTTPPNTTYWTNLSVAATALNVSVETVPTLDPATILASLTKNNLQWFGNFFVQETNRFFHEVLGPMYVANISNNNSTWFYMYQVDPNLSGWIWTNKSCYPFIFSSLTNSWKYIDKVHGDVYDYSSSINSPTFRKEGLPQSYNSILTYSKGDLVESGTSTYIAVKNVPLLISPSNATYWTTLAELMLKQIVPVETVPVLDASLFLASLPSGVPELKQLSLSSTLGGIITVSKSNAMSYSVNSQSPLTKSFTMGTQLTLSAEADRGYVFDDWTGDLVGVSNQIDLLINSDKITTANFGMDLRDNDSDGLSNYDELVLHGTFIDNNDSDGDGFADEFEINRMGTNPNSPNQKLSVYIAEFFVTKAKYDEAMASYPAQESNATPYTNDWFYVPERGWLWTNKSTFPYLFDSNSSDWLHFESGNDIPTFYEYKTKSWVRFE